ncbi:DoxX family protein [Mucilaginibacter pallidiroseus]|uniref:DoxX family protein n=1 Tax=Mucilaginibacter pallidiroseus TaxID=2599295 RepID=A0A563U2E3_9SPHI|nr:DoxX family protein [Mucilaginibacter pallidiroseus]TWR25149.1 DoxX family protein [Mucilaginibacter pallidiroseus]
MKILVKLDELHAHVRANKWMRYFTTFIRLALVAGFLPAGYVKIIGERFTDLHNNQPMGHYLEALHHTGYYYTFIGYAQILAALLLLIPRTVVLGVLLYLPIILNICILSFAVRFEGSLLTAPLMVIACIYLLCWHYDRIKYIFPFTQPLVSPLPQNNKFPIRFFALVFAIFLAVGFTVMNMYKIVPRNTLSDCETQCDDSDNPEACKVFCESIHNNGQDLDKSLKIYEQALKNKRR